MSDEHRCEVREYRSSAACRRCTPGGAWDPECPACRIGCFAPARFRNPEHPGGSMYNYAEWLCAEHYDDVVEYARRRETGDLEPWEREFEEDMGGPEN